MNGILAIDKPKGWTSHHVVARLRRLSKQRRIGHAGTLDPMATGVLVLCLGEATRLSDELMDGVKWYLARVTFGVRTDTDDAMGAVLQRRPVLFSEAELRAALRWQIGAIEQVPPAYAAIKQNGVPIYKAARAGAPVVLPGRPVVVHAINLLSADPTTPECLYDSAETLSVELLITCSKGTYIRSIARDVGEVLGCGGHLSGLRRLASGQLTTRDCVSIDQLQIQAAKLGERAIEACLRPLDLAVTNLPALVLGSLAAKTSSTGRALDTAPVPASGRSRLYARDGSLLGLAAASGATSWHPDKVFNLSGQS